MTPDAECVCEHMRTEHAPPSGPCINLDCDCEQFTPTTSPVAELMRLGYSYADALAACYEQGVPLGELDPEESEHLDDAEYEPSTTCAECGEKHESSARALECCTLAPHIAHAMDPEPEPLAPKMPQDFPAFAEIVDVTTGAHWMITKHAKSFSVIHRLPDGFVTEWPTSAPPRFVSPADYYDPGKWAATPPAVPMGADASPEAFDECMGRAHEEAPVCTDPLPRETVQKGKLWEPPAETYRTETEINGWHPEQGTLIDVPKTRKAQAVPSNQGVLL